MTREVSAMEVRQKFGELLDQVYYRNDQLIVKRANKPMAAIISIEAYQQFIKHREKAFAVLDRVWAKMPKGSSDKIEADIAIAIAEVRQAKASQATEQET